MSISRKDVEHIAELSRLALTEEEISLYTEQLKKILHYVEKLSAVDTGGIEPTTYTIPLQRMRRKDEVSPSLPVEEVLRNAPEKEKNCFKVPRIIE
ncbi:MAG TPA: Asp-tRNA(Asn)/Glu-tRNA(Gln) amidotransferase subunit GatC [Deltaproteobacteria bacterium]|nr:Asp-tRNA(Asn)/Glu-tRNA(Gln) amidotransferase subunit GatC [Deltaproteobacteria bacterium]